jgi:hypothetical protein
MLRVELWEYASPGVRKEVGTIEYQGVIIENAHGGRRIPHDREGKPIPFSYFCQPADLVPQEDILQIAAEIGRRMTAGRVGDYNWTRVS